MSLRALLVILTLVQTACAHHRPVPVLNPKTPETLRAMTFNIQSALRGLPGIAAVINGAQPDFVALQEVDRHTSRSNQLDQAAELSKLTGLPYHRHFGATEYYGGDYGVAIVSRFPILAVEHTPLPNLDGLEPRVVARAELDVNGVKTSVYVTHLAHLPMREPLRVAQAAKILDLIAADPNPKLLLGDLNDHPESAPLTLVGQKLTNVFTTRGTGHAGTFPLPLIGPITLDYVFACEQFEALHSVVIPTDASDHYALIADLKIKAPTAALAQ